MNNGILEQTRAFVAIANTGSISAAASLLGAAQPTISRQLASLVESLGRSLVQRSTRALTLRVMA
jgi:DNA-binding transcriptional LysR family regulator